MEKPKLQEKTRYGFKNAVPSMVWNLFAMCLMLSNTDVLNSAETETIGNVKVSDSSLNVHSLKKEMNQELLSLLKFWSENAPDNEHGGFVGERDINNNIVPDAEKGSVLNARILWTFSAAYNFTKDPKYLETATRAYNYLTAYFVDKENGGLYWALDQNGKVTDSIKRMYAQGFGIYGFSEYYKATGNKEALKQAIDIFERIEKYSYDPQYGGYIEALSTDWKKLDHMGFTPGYTKRPKSMNTHLHILEPYTSLYRVWKDPRLEKRLKELIRVFLDHIVNQETNHFELFFGYNWEVKSSIVSYGHDIEGAWLLVEAAHELGDTQLIEEVEAMSLKLVDATVKDGMCEDGSLNYEKDKNHLDDDKHWWPQAEAMVGFVYAWNISQDDKYLQYMQKTWEFIKENMIDHDHGGWYRRINHKGIAYTSDEKIGFWTCPYHNSRALMEVINHIEE